MKAPTRSTGPNDSSSREFWRQLRVQRREHADAFNYTPEEAEFCESQSHS